jgi:plastocyanin
MIIPKTIYKVATLLSGIMLLTLSSVASAGELAVPNIAGSKHRIEIKDFAFNPQTITIKSGEQVTWVNRDEEPHTVVSVEKQFKKSSALDTDQEFTNTAGVPGTYIYFC